MTIETKVHNGNQNYFYFYLLLHVKTTAPVDPAATAPVAPVDPAAGAGMFTSNLGLIIVSFSLFHCFTLC